MTKLLSPVSRETAKTYGNRNVIITIAPAGSQSEALIGLRLKGKRTQYVVALSNQPTNPTAEPIPINSIELVGLQGRVFGFHLSFPCVLSA